MFNICICLVPTETKRLFLKESRDIIDTILIILNLSRPWGNGCEGPERAHHPQHHHPQQHYPQHHHPQHHHPQQPKQALGKWL